MNNIDRVSRDSKILIESAKDVTASNLLSAVGSKLLQLDEAQLSKVISVVNMSIDEGYMKALPTFQRSVKGLVVEEGLKTKP